MKTALAFVAALLFFPLLALAQGEAQLGVPLPATDDAAYGLAAQAWQLFKDGRYAAACGPVLTVMVWALRKWDTKIPKIGPAIDKFLDQPFVAFLLPIVLSIAIAGTTALLTSHNILDAWNAVVASATSAITTYIGIKKLGEQLAPDRPEPAEPA